MTLEEMTDESRGLFGSFSKNNVSPSYLLLSQNADNLLGGKSGIM